MPNSQLKLKCLIIDDESMGRRLVEEYMRQVPFLDHIASCKNTYEAMDIMNKEKIDLMFLDIQMPGLLGTQFFSSLGAKPMVIFVTAYPEYALEGFELEAIDYIMKPISLERFVKAANKALAMAKSKLSPETPSVVAPAEDPFFFVNADYALVKIQSKNVLYVEGMKDYVKIYLEDQKKPVITKISMTALEEKINSNDFFRVHKSFIVNTQRIKSVRNHVVIINEYEVPISPNKLQELLAKIGYSE